MTTDFENKLSETRISFLTHQYKVLKSSARLMPAYIYHYCPTSALESILTDNKLRFSDAASLNDTKEVVHINEVLSKVTAENKHNWSDDFLEIQKHANVDYSRDMILTNSNYDKKIVGYSVVSNMSVRGYVFCTSLDRNSLPMWNYYSKEGVGQGYNIQLSTSDLELSLSEDKDNFICGKVIYDANEQKDILYSVLGELHKLWENVSSETEKITVVDLLKKEMESLSFFSSTKVFPLKKNIDLFVSFHQMTRIIQSGFNHQTGF